MLDSLTDQAPPNRRQALWVSMLLLVLASGCSHKSPEEKVQPKQEIEPLGPADHQRLREQRAVVEKHLANEDSKRKYETAAGKLGTIRGLLEAGTFEKDQPYELQCLGIVLGDAFVQELGMEWVMVSDEYGRDPAVRLPGTSILLFPLTMISKRVERGEDVDVFEIFNGVAAQVAELSASPEVD